MKSSTAFGLRPLDAKLSMQSSRSTVSTLASSLMSSRIAFSWAGKSRPATMSAKSAR